MERAYWVAFSQIPGIGAVSLKRLQEYFGSATEAWNAPLDSFRAVEGFGNKLIESVAQKRRHINPQEFLEQHTQKNPLFWIPSDPEYPRLLLEIPSPPAILYYRGQVDLRENQGMMPMVSIVGTRHPTDHGRRWTKKMSAALAKQGFVIVSGMAIGIDGEAHKACLEAGGRTIAVLGTGVDVPYPMRHNQLYQEIQGQGLILSEYPAGTQPLPTNFPPRNRIIAGLSRAVLIIEAPEKSGSLITARYAIDFNRDVYALPNTPDNLQARGCLRIIQQGAEMIINEEELLTALGAIPQLAPSEVQLSLFFPDQPEKNTSSDQANVSIAQTQKDLTPTPQIDLEDGLAKILGVIPNGEEIGFDDIVQRSGLGVGEISGGLIQLQLYGLVSELPGMRYQRS